VTVQVNLARDRKATVTGHIVFVSGMVLESPNAGSYGSEYQIRAEVQNRRDGQFWTVRPGMPAWLTIHVSQPPIEVTDAQSASAN
jgi:hypothetical protein